MEKMARLFEEDHRFAPAARREPCLSDPRGSILLLTVVLLSLLSILFLLVTNSVLIGTQAQQSLQTSLEMLYIAEAGLSHGQAFCVAYGERSSLFAGEVEQQAEASESEIDAPIDAWLPFGRGEYRIEAYRSTDPQPFLEMDSGVLLVGTAHLDGVGQKRVCLLLDEPPSCRALAWWEPE